MVVPERFRPAVQAVAGLEAHDRYVGALLFGSVARGATTEASDLDVCVVVAEANPCAALNHPRIAGVKVDLTFRSLEQLEGQLDEQLASGGRAPMIFGMAILFDKTGRLDAVKARADAAAPSEYDVADSRFDQFLLYHANDKVERALDGDPASALWSMHATVNDVLNIHYRICGRFKVSSKNILADLDRWDPVLAGVLRRFVAEGDARAKFGAWRALVDHVAGGLGGRLPIDRNLCDCEVCTEDLAALFRSS